MTLLKPYVSSVIIGANNVHQLEENLAATDLILHEEDKLALDDLAAIPAPYPVWMEPMGFDEQVKAALGQT